jgi:hypothetical protein
VPRRPAKPKSISDWQITRIGKVARYVGQGQAPDAEAAVRRAIENARTVVIPAGCAREHPNKPMDHEGCTGAGMP